MWFGTDNGASKFDGTNWTTYTTADGLADNTVRSIAIDYNGNKWFGTGEYLSVEGGITKFDGINWITYTTADGLADNFVRSIAIDKDGNKWIGTDGGLSVLTKNKIGDVNQDQDIDLEDVIIILKLLTGTPQTVHLSADVNQDNKIGMEEALYILNYISLYP